MGDFMTALSEKSRQFVEAIRRKRESPIQVQKRSQQFIRVLNKRCPWPAAGRHAR
jgi:hypothetical protein